MTTRWRVLLVAAFGAAFGLRNGSARAAATDYLPTNTGWNGISALAELADRAGLDLQLSGRLDWGEIEAQDLLLFVYPRNRIDANALIDFLERGGHAVIADDYGESTEALRALQIERRTPRRIDADRYWEANEDLPIARPASAFDGLTRGVDRLVANHPAYFWSRWSAPFYFGSSSRQLVVRRTVGKGQVIAIADPSVLLNNMRQFPGNRVFASNLIREISSFRPARVLLFSGYFEQMTNDSIQLALSSAEPPNQLIRRLNAALQRLSDFALTEPGMRTVTLVAGGLFLLLLFAAVPLPSRDERRALIEDTSFRQRSAASAAEDPAETLYAAGILRHTIAGVLGAHLEVSNPTSLLDADWVAARLRERHALRVARKGERLWRELLTIPRTLEAAQEGPDRRWRPRDLKRLHDRATELLRLIEGNRSGGHRG